MNSIIKNADGSVTIDGVVYERRSTEATSETKESVFAEMVKKLERKEDRAKYPNSVFWFNKDGQFIFEHDEKNDIFWCSYALVWSVFKSKFSMNYNEIQDFTKCMVEKHFKCNGVTPYLMKFPHGA